MGYLRLIRPLNCIIAFLAVYVGAWIGKSVVFNLQLLCAGTAAFLVCAFGNIVNDLKDIEIDRINNPHRPLPSGSASKTMTIILAIFLFFAASTCSFSLGLYPSLLVTGALIMLLAYAFSFKKTVLGNFVVALVSGLSFILGGIITNNPVCLVPFVFSFFIHIPREILKDVMDMEGDRAGGVLSLPIIYGTVPSFRISALLLCSLCILVPLPFFMKLLGSLYLGLMVIGAYPILIFLIVQLLKNPQYEDLPRYSSLLKLVMIIGLVGMIV